MKPYEKPRWKIEVSTGDREPYPEWVELHGRGKRYRFVDREEAEHELEKFCKIQPHSTFRIAPL